MFRKKEINYISKTTTEIFSDCMFAQFEYKNGIPIKEFTVVQGLTKKAYLNTEKLNEHKKSIKQLVEMLQNTDKTIPMVDLRYTKKGKKWFNADICVDRLMLLAVGAEILSYYPSSNKKDWENLPYGVPYVVKNKERQDTLVVGYSPEEYIAKQKVNELIKRFTK